MFVCASRFLFFSSRCYTPERCLRNCALTQQCWVSGGGIGPTLGAISGRIPTVSSAAGLSPFILALTELSADRKRPATHNGDLTIDLEQVCEGLPPRHPRPGLSDIHGVRPAPPGRRQPPQRLRVLSRLSPTDVGH